MDWKRRKEKPSDFSDSPALTYGQALLVQPHFKAKGPANINSRGAAAGAERQTLAYWDLSTLNNGSSDARAFGSATETRAAQKSLSSVRLYLRSLNIYPTGKHTIFHSFCSERRKKPRTSLHHSARSPSIRTGEGQRKLVSSSEPSTDIQQLSEVQETLD